MKSFSHSFIYVFLFCVFQTNAQIINQHRQKRLTHNNAIQDTKGIHDFIEPQWKMKFYFEDATGAKDTLTVGYDPSANMYSEIIDSQFDEGWEEIDTTQFNVYLYKFGEGSEIYPIPPPIDVNIVRKTSITSWSHPNIAFGWVHGQPPISITWDDEMLDSERLPNVFVDLDDYPRARIDLWVQVYEWMITGCIQVFEDPEPPAAMLSNNPDLLNGYCSCVISDELIFDIESDNEIGDIMDIPFFVLEPYNDFYWLSSNAYNYHNITIYPNPVENILTIEMVNVSDIDYAISDIYGKIIKEGVFLQEQDKAQVDISNLANGIYFIKTEFVKVKFVKN